MSSFPPFALFFAAALVVLFLRGPARSVFMVLIPILGGLNLLNTEPGAVWQLSFLGYELTPYRVDRLSLLFVIRRSTAASFISGS